MKRIPQSTIDQIFAACDVVEVVGDFLQLKKRGGNHWAKSPFTNEKTPSFAVSQSKGIWKDFSTGKGGNSVGFLMESEGMSYPEALRYLADKYKIEIPQDGEDDKPDTSGAIKAVTNRASQLFHSNADTVREYLHGRGISDHSIEHWQIGHSPDEQGYIANRLVREGYSKEIIVAANLCFVQDDGTLIDRFRGRVIFPICNPFGNPIAFGGRSLRNVGAKYINTSETEIYHKSKALFGLHHARKSMNIQDRCILVEGYMDVIMLHQHGHDTAIASCGTALTVDQCKTIGRYAQNILIARDSDDAGIKATARDVRVMLGCGQYPSVLPLPKGQDPDSFVKEHGGQAFADHIAKHSRQYVHFLVKFAQRENPGTEPQQIAAVAKQVRETLDVIADPVLKTLSYQTLADLLGLSRNLMRPKEVVQHLQANESPLTTMHTHEVTALRLLVNNWASTNLEAFQDLVSNIPSESFSAQFSEALTEMTAVQGTPVDRLLSGPKADIFIACLEMEAQQSNIVEALNEVATDFARHHIDRLIAECREVLKTTTDKQTYLSKMQTLSRMRRELLTAPK